MAKQQKFSGKSAFAGKKTGASKPKKSGSRASSGRRGGNAWAAYTGRKSSQSSIPF